LLPHQLHRSPPATSISTSALFYKLYFSPSRRSRHILHCKLIDPPPKPPSISSSPASMEGNRMLGRCIRSETEELHIVDFYCNSTREYLINQIVDRWDDLSPTDIILSYILPDDPRAAIQIKQNNDVKNMHQMHSLLGVSQARLVVDVKTANGTQQPPNLARAQAQSENVVTPTVNPPSQSFNISRRYITNYA